MRVIFYLVLCMLYSGNTESKCKTLLMCPSFCMKVKEGCYVCDCDMFSDYLHRAAGRMTSASNRQPSQTGTQLSSYTSGYSANGNNRGMPNIQNGLSVQDYSNTMQGEFQYMNLQPYNTKPLLTEISASGFTEYGHSYQNMPGMNCSPVDDRCPSSCWTTDVYTGCVHCGCAHSSSSGTKTENHHEYNENTDEQGIHSETNKQESHQTPTEQTSEQLSTSTKPSTSASNVVRIIVPTKPPKAVTTMVIKPVIRYENITPRLFGFAVPTPLQTSSITKIMSENRSFAVPTPLPTSNYGDTINRNISHAVPIPLQLSSNGHITHENHSFTVSTPLPVSNYSYKNTRYPVPTPRPRIKNYFLLSSQSPKWTFSENSTPYSNHTKNLKMSQTKSKPKEQFHEGLTAASRIIDVHRDSNVNNTIEITEQTVQSTSFSKLEQPRKPLITAWITPFKTTTESNRFIPLYLSLANTGSFHRNSSTSTSGESSYYGFYGHAKTG